MGYYERSERTPEEKYAIDGLDTTDAMTVTLGSNLNNETAGSLYPGARGKITFTVKPLVSDLDGVTISLSRLLKVTNTVGVVGDGGNAGARGGGAPWLDQRPLAVLYELRPERVLLGPRG